MKLHRSFGKTLAVATIAFMISSAASAQAQQGRSGRDRCFHSERVRPAVRGPMVPPVYMYPVPNAGRSYRDYRRGERPLLTGQRWADMAAEQEALRARRLQTLGALKSQLEILVQARQAQLAAQRRTLQDAPTMSPKARASQELAGQQMVGPQMQGLIRSILPNDTSATPKPNCTIISSSDCY
jgi:hypothetical protein